MSTPRKQKKKSIKPARRDNRAGEDAAVIPSIFGGSLLSLESRIMFDGAAVATASIVSAEQTAQNQAEDSISSGDAATTDAPTNEPSATADQALLDALEALDVSSTRQEMLFVSTNVLDYQQLLDGISLNVAAQILDPARDGVEQMADTSSNYASIDPVNLIGDGTEAGTHLNSSFLIQSSISTSYAEQFQQIGQSLLTDTELLIDGRSVGQGEAGQFIIDTSASLTAADVAASKDRTVLATENADWLLEVTTGSIETSSVISKTTGGAGDGQGNLILATTVGTQLDDAPAATDSTIDVISGALAPARVEIVFVDTSVENYQALLADVNPNAIVVLLDETRDGIQQIADYLANRQNVDAIHIVSHGSEGVLQLGTAALDADSMREQYAALLAEIGSHLSETSDILVYGCEFGKGDAGQKAVMRLASLTGADVEASDDLTGAAKLGGDWVLELSTGQIETGIIFSELVQLDFDNVLASPSVDLNGSASGSTVTVAFTEGTPVLIAPVGTVSDNDNDVVSLKATLTTRPDGNAVESLSLNAAATTAASGAGLTVSYTPATGVLTITGVATVATYTTILQGILYNDMSDTPTTTNRTVDVQVRDNTAANSANKTSTITVAAVNDAPNIVDATVALNENSANGSAVTNVSDSFTGTDFDRDGAAITYSITGGNALGGFAINAATGAITVANSAVLDFETTPSFTLTVTVSDGTLSDTAAITVNLNNLNDNAPNIVDATVALNENSANGSAVTNVSDSFTGTDFDRDGAALTYSITGGNGLGAFAINAATGEITVADAGQLHREALAGFVLTVAVTDGTFSDTAAITINLSDVQEFAPVVNDATVALAENTPNGTSVYTATATDADGAETLTYSITGGNGLGAFAINAATGEITVADAGQLDREALAGFVLTVAVTDGTFSDTAAITINLSDVQEFAPVVNDATVALAENTPNGTSVYTATATDADGAETLTYSITGGNGLGAFAINAATGEITVADAGQLDREALAGFVLTVAVTDGTLSDTAAITVKVTNVNEVPVLGDDTATTTQNTVVTTANVLGNDNDPESVLNAGNITAFDAMSANGGTVVSNGDGTFTYTPALNFTGTDTFTYTVSDGVLTDTATVTITVTPAGGNSAPTLMTNAGAIVLAGFSDPITSDQLQVTDVDNTPAQLLYTVLSAPQNGRLELTTTPGVAITSFTQADINAGRLIYVHNGSTSTGDSVTFTVSDGVGGTIAATTFNFTVMPFFPPPLGWPPAPGPAAVPFTDLSGPPSVGVQMPVTAPSSEPTWLPGRQNPDVVQAKIVDKHDEPAPRVTRVSNTFTSVEHVEPEDIVPQEPSDLPPDSQSPLVKKVLAVGHNFEERLTKEADILEQAIEERIIVTALSTGFMVWLLRRGSSLTSSFTAMLGRRKDDE